MISEILIYFFIVFGVLQFSVCVWEFFTGREMRKNAVVVVKQCDNYYDIVHSLKKYPFEIYVLADEIPQAGFNIKDFEFITKDLLLQKLES